VDRTVFEIPGTVGWIGEAQIRLMKLSMRDALHHALVICLAQRQNAEHAMAGFSDGPPDESPRMGIPVRYSPAVRLVLSGGNQQGQHDEDVPLAVVTRRGLQ
jgi:hypothetical protein